MGTAPPEASRTSLHAQYWDALVAADRFAALRAVKALKDGGCSTAELLDDLVVPAQQRIGDLWVSGEWGVAQEHAATAVNEGLVHWLCSFSAPPSEEAPLVVVACVAGERHAMPALVVAEGLALEGLRVHYLGADPDPADLLAQVELLRPRAVLLSATLSASLASTKALFAGVRALGVPVVVGGRAFGGDARRAEALGATAYAPDVATAVRLVRELPPVDPGPAAAVGHPGEVEGGRIAERQHEIVPTVLGLLTADAGPTPGVSRAELVDHVRHVLGSLAAALVSEDESILVETRDWLAHLLASRGAGPDLVARLWAAVGAALGEQTTARRALDRTAPGRLDVEVPA